MVLPVDADCIPVREKVDGIFERILQGFLMKDLSTMHLTNLVIPH